MFYVFIMFSMTNTRALETFIYVLLVCNVIYLMLYAMRGYTQTDRTAYHVRPSRLGSRFTPKSIITTPHIDIGESTKLSAAASESIVYPSTSSSKLAPLLAIDEQERTSCKVKTDWNKFLLHPSVTSDLTYWNFTATINCMYENVLDANIRKTKFNFHFDCSDKNSADKINTAYQVNEAKTNSHIQVVEFGDECLLNFIENCCYNSYRVPNVVHYVMYQKSYLQFFEFVSFYSVIRFVRPCAILIHGDNLPTGSYWDYIRVIFPNIIHVRRAPPMVIGGKIRGYLEHSGDIMRLEALLKYGGIYLDLDTVFVKPIDKLRSFPCTMSKQSSALISSAFISSERNSSFIYKWYSEYHNDYQPRLYLYNAMIRSSWLSRRFPSDVHLLYGSLSRPWYQSGAVVFDTNYKWRDIYGIHLFSRKFKSVMDEEKVKIFNSTIGSICRHILYGNKELCHG